MNSDWNNITESEREEIIATISRALRNDSSEVRVEAVKQLLQRVDFRKEADVLDCVRRLFRGGTYTPHEVRTVALYHFHLFDGGTERVLALLTHLFTKLGKTVIVITDDKASDLDYTIADGVERLVFDADAHLFSGKLDLQHRLECWHSFIASHHIDLVCYTLRWSPLRAFDLLAIWASNAFCLMCDHNAAFGCLAYSAQEFAADKDVFGLANAVVTLARSESLYWRSMGIPSFMIPNPPVFELDPQPAVKEPNILWLGRLHPIQKCPTDALYVLKLVKEQIPNVRMTILGDGEERDNVRQTVRDLGLQDNVDIVGFHSDVAPFFRNQRVHLMTSTYEYWPLVWVEAKSKGIPTAMYELPGLELARQFGGALYAPQKNIPMLAEQVIKLLKDDGLYNRLRLECPDCAHKFNVETVGKCWQELFRSFEHVRPEADTNASVPFDDVAAMVAMLRIGIANLTRFYDQRLSVAYGVTPGTESSEIGNHRIVRLAIGLDALTRKIFVPGNTPIRRFARGVWGFAAAILKGFRLIFKQAIPYGLMYHWLKFRYGMVIDRPLFAYPGLFKRIRRIVKFLLPYGLVCLVSRKRH